MAKLVGKQTHTLSVMSGQATKLVDKDSWKRFILMMHPTHKVQRDDVIKDDYPIYVTARTKTQKTTKA